MEFYECVTYVIDKMRKFEREIIIDCPEGAEAVLVQALNTNLKLNFYFAGVQFARVLGGANNIKITLEYKNKETPSSQVIVVTKEEDVTPKLSCEQYTR